MHITVSLTKVCLGQKSPWTTVYLDKNLLGQNLLGQMSLGQLSSWKTVTLDNHLLDNCCNTPLGCVQKWFMYKSVVCIKAISGVCISVWY